MLHPHRVKRVVIGASGGTPGNVPGDSGPECNPPPVLGVVGCEKGRSKAGELALAKFRARFGLHYITPAADNKEADASPGAAPSSSAARRNAGSVAADWVVC